MVALPPTFHSPPLQPGIHIVGPVAMPPVQSPVYAPPVSYWQNPPYAVPQAPIYPSVPMPYPGTQGLSAPLPNTPPSLLEAGINTTLGSFLRGVRIAALPVAIFMGYSTYKAWQEIKRKGTLMMASPVKQLLKHVGFLSLIGAAALAIYGGIQIKLEARAKAKQFKQLVLNNFN